MKGRVWLVLVMVIILTLAPGAVSGEGGPPGLTGGPLETSNVVLRGGAAGEQAGYSVAIVGALGGDGIENILVGEPGDVEQGTGAALLYGVSPTEFGGLDWTQHWAAYIGENSGDQAGFSVAAAGDVNGDGFPDMLIGAPGYGAADGRAYLLFGLDTGYSGGHLSLADAIYAGVSGMQLGYNLSGAGDFNDDGFDDILIGAPGNDRAFLFLGSESAAGADLATDTPDLVFEGTTDSDAGYSVAGVGDVNGDGLDDVLIGAPGSIAGTTDGDAFLILGRSTGFPLTVNPAAADRRYYGNSGQSLGFSVSGAGDVNGDGLSDMLISFTGGNGGAYLLFGSFSPKASCTLDLCTDEGYRGISGAATGGRVGGVGDVNGDGYGDFMVGSCGYPNSGNRGLASLVLGHGASQGVRNLDEAASASYFGMRDNETGCVIARSWGDVNGDTLDDLVIGSPGFGNDMGRAYVVFGDSALDNSVRYRLINPSKVAFQEVGQSGVAVRTPNRGWSGGSIYVTRHYRHTCSTNVTTGGLLWRVEVQYTDTESLSTPDLMFSYNDQQIAHWIDEEPSFRLYMRENSCGDWVEVAGADLDIAQNRITVLGADVWNHEFTIAPLPPNPTALNMGNIGVSMAGTPTLLLLILGVLAVATLAAEWHSRRSRNRRPH